MTEDEWEALCDGCGKCCALGGTHYACPSLNTKTRRCSVYARRTTTEMCLKVTPENVDELHARGILPDTCGYVRHARGLEPLSTPPKARLLKFERAPRAMQNEYLRQRAAWLKEREHDALAEREAARGDRRAGDTHARRRERGDSQDRESGESS